MPHLKKEKQAETYTSGCGLSKEGEIVKNVIVATFDGNRSGNAVYARTEPLWQYDYGQVLRFDGIDLPMSYEVHFSNSENGTSKTQIGDADGVAIPDEYLTSGKNVYACVFLHEGAEDGETEYCVVIPVNKRSRPSDEPPTPEQQSAITQALAALESAVGHVDEIAEGIEDTVKEITDTALEEAKESGEFDGPAGATFTPEVSEYGVVSWTNDRGLPNPEPIDMGQNFALRYEIEDKLDKSEKGTAGGVAELDANGKIPSDQLPSFVDDVVEYPSVSAFPSVGESGKIYISTSNTTAYRWSGTTYVPIGGSLVLGETSSTAYRGDRGKEAFDHAQARGRRYVFGMYKFETNSEGHVLYVEPVTKQDILALGIVDASGKADKADTVLDTSLSRGRKADTQAGYGSFAFGNDVEASGMYSHAEGYGTVASGYTGAHAEGHNTQATDDGTHAEGYGSIASSDYAHAEGNGTKAGGYASHAEGGYTEAWGLYGHAEGYQAKATGVGSHAEGSGTQASGGNSHSEGSNSNAEGNVSHAEGNGTNAYAPNSHAEGAGTRAYGNTSHAEGGGATTIGYGSHAEGGGTTAYGSSAHAEGGGARAVGSQAHAEGGGTTAIGTDAHAEGSGTMAIGPASHAEGTYTIANGAYSHVFGRSNVEDVGDEVPPDWAPNTAYSVGDRIKVARTYSGDGHSSDVTVTEYYKCSYAHTSGETFSTSSWNADPLKYAEIVGNGTGNQRSNARVLDWNGNERLMGDLYVQCNSDSAGGVKVATENQLPVYATDAETMMIFANE